MRVHVVDPPAYTPPYDRMLCGGLARAGAETRLITSRFTYASVAPAEGFAVDEEAFYRHLPRHSLWHGRRLARAAQHVPDMLRYRRRATEADVVHFQWLTAPELDWRLLPRDRPVVLTAHHVTPLAPRRRQVAALRRVYERVDAIVVHTREGVDRLEQLGVPREKARVIPHGAFTHLAEEPEPAPLPPELAGVEGPVALLFGLMRPYKGIDVALEAWRGITDAELWVIGLPQMDTAPLRASAPSGVRFVERFVTDREIPALFRRADVVLLPYRRIDQSGVLFTALAFGRPLVVSAVGGFPEIAEEGLAELVPPGDPAALRERVRELLGDPARRAALGDRALTAAHEQYGWDAIARAHLDLYATLVRG